MACIAAFGKLCYKPARVEPEPEAQFQMVLSCHQGESIGLVVAATRGTKGLVVVSIRIPSATSRWNLTSPNPLEIGHVVSSINGITGEMEMLAELRRVKAAEFTINPAPSQYQREIHKEATKLYRKRKAIFGLLEDVTPPAPLEVCAICHEDMDAQENKPREVRLPCGHRYHAMCIKDWFRSGRFRCPLCNYDLSKDMCEASDGES
mmetsp:Transcript_30356/g.37222  ORF Transcript_30356/g.37222 Transcript_30356/m.37222 type:complete len:206 (-) Transcript_30356:303-920(-)